MTLICTVAVIAFHFISKTEVEGKVLSQTETRYYVDFSEDLKKNDWQLSDGRGGKKLVLKSDCVEKSK